MIAFVALGLSFTQCKEGDEPVEESPADYRETYIGDWHFHVSKSFYDMSDSFSSKEEIQFDGEIVFGSAADELLIRYTGEDLIELSVDRDGVLSEFPTKYCSGSFVEPDSVHIYLRWGGLGSASTHVVDGVRP